ncbi:MAG: tetratricopeptide repeat protein [Ignavibacteriales bacterium]|nr:tetratricopeptide repeat protein [Ignavibacteriales bacterium]
MIKKILTIFLFTFSIFAQQNSLDQNQFMLAESYEQKGDLTKAVEILETLNKKDPGNIQYFNKLNTLYLQLKKYDESIKIINSRILLTPQDISLYGMLGSTYYTSGDRTKAYQVWDDAIDKFKTNQMTLRIISNFVIDRRDFEKAIEYLNRGKESSQDPFLYSYDLGELYQITMRYREAASEYCDLIKANQSQYQQIENKILSYTNKPNALEETIETVEKHKSENISFEYLLARLYIEKKDYSNAFDLYKEIDKKQNTNGSDLYSFGNFVYRDGEYKTASEVFTFLIDNYNDQQNTPLAKLGYAKTQEALFIQHYNLLNPEWKPFSSLQKLDGNEINPVIEAYEEIVKTYTHSEVGIEANLRIGILFLHYQNNFAEAERYLKLITESYPTSKVASLAFIELGNIFLQKANLIEAEKHFNMQLSLRALMLKIKVLQIISLQEFFLSEMILNQPEKIFIGCYGQS